MTDLQAPPDILQTAPCKISLAKIALNKQAKVICLYMSEFYLAYYLVQRHQRHGVIPPRTLTTAEVAFYVQKVFVLLHIVSFAPCS